MNLAYIAGFFDGEGCVNFTKCRTSIYPRVLVVNTNREILEELRDRFGGDISPLSRREDGWKQGWSWRLSWSKAVDFLDKIEPWLVLKSKQAQTVFAWDAIRIGRGRKPENDKEDHAKAVDLLVKRMHWLNKRGDKDPIDPIEAVALGRE